jgi:cellulose synthase/poly-beta-1,6-N-acetylglucosamine synthase-like glycosyltransferase
MIEYLLSLPRALGKMPVHALTTLVLAIAALVWIVQGTRAWRGMGRIPRITDVAPLTGERLPRMSILFAARNEAEKLPAALASLLTLDYPDYEVIAVNDRSSDRTGRILEEFAAAHRNLKVARIDELPPGWLGKPHALETAYRHATGEWLIFTDADVRFAPELLRRALALARERDWDHLTLLAPLLDLSGFWETVAVSYFGFAFVFGGQPWRVSDARAGSYAGVGAFQLLRRSTYEAIGTHQKLAMEVVDDMKLGKLVKSAGFHSGTATSEALVQVRWQEGFHEVVRGLTKNLFAAFAYSSTRTLAAVLLIFAISILPLAALPFTTGLARLFAGISVAMAVIVHARLVRASEVPPLYGLTHALGAAIFCYIALRSMVVTLWRGGVLWRGTFYLLEDLKRGLV